MKMSDNKAEEVDSCTDTFLECNTEVDFCEPSTSKSVARRSLEDRKCVIAEANDEDTVDMIDLRPDSDSDEDSSRDFKFKKRKTSHSRKYRKKNENAAEDDEIYMTPNEEEDNKPDLTDSENTDPSSDEREVVPPAVTAEDLQNISELSSDTDIDERTDQRKSRIRARRIVRAEDLVSGLGEDEGNDYNDNNSSTTDEDGVTADDIISEKTKELVFKPLSKPKYHLTRDLHERQLGISLTPSFQARQCASVELVKRLKLEYKLQGHQGCVNSLNWNQSGTKLASGSDDLNIIVWDWQSRKKMVAFNTGHKANVFQSKFLPGDLLITSCSRDGQVRLAELSTSGSFRSTRKLAQHKAPAHKMSLLPDNPYVVLSAGEDGQVFSIDIRENKPCKALLLKNEKDKKVPLYSIHSNPVDGNQFCTSGREPWVRVFDRRYLDFEERREVGKFCPTHLQESEEVGGFRAYITAAVFSHNGGQLLASYNDEDIYLFDTQLNGEEGHFLKRYQGHRNSATTKGVNFYGPRSEFVVSGSDCGNVFIWDKETSGLVTLMAGDDNGVVNVLEPHPHLPVLATSGLDDEVKVWMPFEETSGPGQCWQRQKEYMQKTVQKNLNERERQRVSEPDPLDGQMLWVLWRHIRRAERRRREAASARGEEEEGSELETSEEEEESEEEGPRGRMCNQS